MEERSLDFTGDPIRVANPLFSGRPRFARFMIGAKAKHIRARLQDEKNGDHEADFGDEAPHAQIKCRPPKVDRGRIRSHRGMPSPIIPQRFEHHWSDNKKARAADPPAADVQPAKAPLLGAAFVSLHSSSPRLTQRAISIVRIAVSPKREPNCVECLDASAQAFVFSLESVHDTFFPKRRRL